MQPIQCMTLDIEKFHASVHTKQLNISMLEYARSFGATMKESIKRLTHWAAYCHTSNLGIQTGPILKLVTLRENRVSVNKKNCMSSKVI